MKAVMLTVFFGTATLMAFSTGANATHPHDPELPSHCPRTVFVIGDSLTDPSRGGSAKYLPGAFKHLKVPVHVYAKNGLSTRSALQERYKYGLGSTRAKQADTWIIALGTNDQVRYGFPDRIRQVMRLANRASATVWWVNTSRPRSWQEGPGGPVNRALSAAAVRHKNLTIINYASQVRANKHLLARDRVHLTSRGAKWRARLYASPFAECTAPRPDPVQVDSTPE